MKIKPYNKTILTVDFETVKEAELHLQLSKLKIIGRICYIYKTIASGFGAKLNWSLEDYEIKDFDIEYLNDCRDDIYCCYGNPLDDFLTDARALIKNHKGSKVEHDFSDGSFPTRWIFEDFEDELKSGIKEHEDMLKKELEEEEVHKQRLAKAKKDRKNIIARVKKKLTPEEIEVVFG